MRNAMLAILTLSAALAATLAGPSQAAGVRLPLLPPGPWRRQAPAIAPTAAMPNAWCRRRGARFYCNINPRVAYGQTTAAAWWPCLRSVLGTINALRKPCDALGKPWKEHRCRMLMASIVAVPKKKLAAYVLMAKKVGNGLGREYGALDYREWVAEDVKVWQAHVISACGQTQAG